MVRSGRQLGKAKTVIANSFLIQHVERVEYGLIENGWIDWNNVMVIVVMEELTKWEGKAKHVIS